MRVMGQLLSLFCFSFSVVVLLSLFPFFTSASDPSMLQDICVADFDSEVRMNGFACKKAEEVTEMDFWSDVMANPGDTNNKLGFSVTSANVLKVPGLNTLGISSTRIDYAPNGRTPPHYHPRASEMVFVVEGDLLMVFITTAGQYIGRVVKPGEVFVFPRGLIHYQQNLSTKPASVRSWFDSQNPGVQFVSI